MDRTGRTVDSDIGSQAAGGLRERRSVEAAETPAEPWFSFLDEALQTPQGRDVKLMVLVRLDELEEELRKTMRAGILAQ